MITILISKQNFKSDFLLHIAFETLTVFLIPNHQIIMQVIIKSRFAKPDALVL